MVRVGGGAAQVVQRGVRSQTKGIYQLCVCCYCSTYKFAVTAVADVVAYFRLLLLVKREFHSHTKGTLESTIVASLV